MTADPTPRNRRDDDDVDAQGGLSRAGAPVEVARRRDTLTLDEFMYGFVNTFSSDDAAVAGRSTGGSTVFSSGEDSSWCYVDEVAFIVEPEPAAAQAFVGEAAP